MAFLSRVAIFRQRRPAIIATTLLKDSRRLIDVPFEDIALRKIDFPNLEHDYLTVVSKEWFQGKYGLGRVSIISEPSRPNIPRRLAAVLPLELEDGAVIPIPLLLFTGAPGMLYLGSKPLSVLNDMGLIKDATQSGQFPYRVSGRLSYAWACYTQ